MPKIHIAFKLQTLVHMVIQHYLATFQTKQKCYVNVGQFWSIDMKLDWYDV